jgi:WD40 repeat protein
MELVHGVPITRFCDDNKLTPRERLELFVPVCQAIQHAHTKGIIHRDIKPSNVLVTLYDDRPVPKVIDFGVAKAVEQRLTERTMFTQFGALVGTFEYMSPEQAEMNAFGVDTRSDVYSLGVLLYELLTGTTPLEGRRLREAALDEVVRLIKEEEPPRPSVRLSSSDTLPKIAAACKTEPARLSKLVRGEIDWIVMKCLEKDRSHRYETASGLARDVERYLHDEPVEACPPSAGYRLRKFARKYRRPLLVAAGFALLLLAGVAVSTWQAVRATAAQREAVANSEAAGEAQRDAVAKREEAEGARQALRRSLYASDLQLAQAAWGSGNTARVLDLLKRQRPGPGEDDLRSFEWHYWNRLCRTELRIVKLSSGQLWGVLSPEGTRYVAPRRGTAGGASTRKEIGLRLWDATTGKELPGLRPYPGESLSTFFRPTFSPDGKRLAFVGYVPGPGGRLTARLKVLDCDSGRELLALAGLPDSAHHAFGAKGGLLAVVTTPPGSPGDCKLTLWDVATRKELRTVPLAGGRSGSGGPSMALSPDGTRLAAVTTAPGLRDRVAPGEVRVWDTGSGKEVLRFQTGPGGMLGALAYSPDGKSLAVAGEKETTLKLRDAASGELLLELTGQGGEFTNFAYSPDGARLASASGDGKVRLWDVSAGGPKGSRAPARVLQGIGAPLHWVAFSADGRTVSAVGPDMTILTWEVVVREQPVVVRQPGGKLVATAAAAAASRFAAAWESSKAATEIKVWDVAGKVLFSAKDVSPGPYESLMRYLRLSADGTRLAYSAVDHVSTRAAGKPTHTGRLRVWEVAAGRELFRRDGERASVTVDQFSPDGRRLATSCLVTSGDVAEALTSRVSVWDLASDREMLGLDVPGFARLAFSPDGRRLAAGLTCSPLEDREAELRVWDIATGEGVLRRPGFRGWIGAPVFNCDGTRLAVGAGDRGGAEVHLLDAVTGEDVAAPLKGHRATAAQMAFSPDGRRLVSYAWYWSQPTGEIKVWDVADGRELLTLTTKGEGSFALSPDGRRLYLVGGLNGGPDAEVQVWDATPLPDGQ